MLLFEGGGWNCYSLKADVPCKTICLQTRMKESQKQLRITWWDPGDVLHYTICCSGLQMSHFVGWIKYFIFLFFKWYCIALVIVLSWFLSPFLCKRPNVCFEQRDTLHSLLFQNWLFLHCDSEASKILIRKWSFYIVHPTITSEGWTCEHFIEKVPKSTRWADQQNANSKLQWGNDFKWPIWHILF